MDLDTLIDLLCQTRLADSAKLNGREAPNKDGGNAQASGADSAELSHRLPQSTVESEAENTTDAVVELAYSLLCGIGIDEQAAARLAETCDVDDVRGWVTEAGRGTLDNPAGLVVARLQAGVKPPQRTAGKRTGKGAAGDVQRTQDDAALRRRYISGEYALYIDY